MKTIEMKLYKFNELSEETQEKVINDIRNSNWYMNWEWWDFIYEQFIEDVLPQNGFDATKIYFSGFWSQGDGAMFEYDSISDELVNEFIESLDLSPMRKNWLREWSYISSSGKHSGHYYHEKSCSHRATIEPDNGDIEPNGNIANWIYSFQIDFEDWIEDKYVDSACYLYKVLEQEYEEITSDDHIKYFLINNDYEFTEDGEMR